MNFKTTFLLAIVLLVLAAGYFLTTREESKAPTKAESSEKLVSMAAADVNRISIAPRDGAAVVLERAEGEWKITAPVSAKAEKWAVDDLVNSLTGLQSRGETEVQEKDRAALGLDRPTKVTIADKNGKSTELAFGTRSAVGDSTYVEVTGERKAKVVGADVLEKLEEPLKKYRDARLADVNSTDVKQVVVNRPEGNLRMEKRGENWVLTQPEEMPLESFAVSDIVSGVTNLRATEFVSEDASAAAKYGLAQPRYSVQLSTAAPATQPSASAPAFTQLRIGSYDDIRKQNVYAMAGEAGPIAKVPASVITSLSKKPLEMRDKKVLEFDPATVQSIAIATDIPAATQPTTREASRSALKIVRNQASDLQGPPATTQAATEPVTAWLREDDRKPADEEKVKALLDELKALRATRYLESMPEGAPNATYKLTITTIAAGGAEAKHDLTVVDRGTTSSPVGQYQGLIFELDRELLSKLKLD